MGDEIVLVHALSSAPGSILAPRSFWVMAVVQLLPLLVGMELLWRLRCAVRDAVMDSLAADFLESRAALLLFAAYAAVSICELSLIGLIRQ